MRLAARLQLRREARPLRAAAPQVAISELTCTEPARMRLNVMKRRQPRMPRVFDAARGRRFRVARETKHGIVTPIPPSGAAVSGLLRVSVVREAGGHRFARASD